MLNRLVRWLAFREFFIAALKEGGLHIHRDPVRKAKPIMEEKANDQGQNS